MTPTGAAVLIVDDHDDKRLAISAIVEPLGHEIVEASSGEEALKKVLEQPFAVILMDVQMPVMDGYETARLIRMRQDSQHTPIVFVTAHTRDEAQLAIAYASGAVDFIFAPVLPDILRAKVSIFADLFIGSKALERSIASITELGEQFRDSEARIRSVLENVADGIVTVSDEGVIESLNSAALALFGVDEHDAVDQPFSMLVTPQNPADFAGRDAGGQPLLTLPTSTARPAAAVGLRKDGSSFPMELDVRNVELGTRQVHIACMRDVSERQSYVEALKYQALHDGLTELPNRALFEDRVNHAIMTAGRAKQSLALLLLDLDGFKAVNDTLGHQRGDTLLKLVGERVAGCLREGDTVARLGGDEFGVLPLTGTDLPGAATVALKIGDALREPFVVEGHEVEISASIGMTFYPQHGDNIDDLLRRADLAMYDAKRKGRGYAVFAAEQEEAPARRLALFEDLQHCVERGEMVLHYQPKIDLTTGKTVGVEALIRWQHPTRGLLMPGEFMPEVENNELILPITDWVIEEALGQLQNWRNDGYDLTMAVNIGARCLGEDTSLFETADELTSRFEIPPDHLTFELTESALIDTSVAGLVDRLQGMDERLSIDDFGTGYSSLAYLQRMPVVEIKADKSFVTTLTLVNDDAVIVRSIIDLAHNLGLTVVAEGVEDEATMDALVEYGCDAAQGFYFCRPVPEDELVPWLASSPFGAERALVTPTVGA